jgi:hypothetical protein
VAVSRTLLLVIVRIGNISNKMVETSMITGTFFRKTLILVFSLSFLLFSCDNPTDSNNNGKTNSTAKIEFANNTQFYVDIYRDSSLLLVEKLPPGSINTNDIRESIENHVGTTFRYSYHFKLSADDDTFSGSPYASGYASDLEETFVIEKGKIYTRKIPIPTNISFNNAFIRIRNNVPYNVLLKRYNAQLLQEGNSELMIPSGKTGIYRINSDDLNMNDYSLTNVDVPYNFPQMILRSGYVYDFILTDVNNEQKIIPDIQMKIKPSPVKTWRKDVTKYNNANFVDINSSLNNNLKTIHRYDISYWRSHHPVNQLIFDGSNLIYGEWSFGIIPAIIQNTGIAEAYEIPTILAKDTSWTSSIIPVKNVYSGTTTTAYHTTFNDIVKINSTYVVLSTYSKGIRTGIMLSFLNEQGQVIDTWDEPFTSNLESLTGVKLVKLENNSFLVLGRKKIYVGASDEHFTTSYSMIYKFLIGNNIPIWKTEYDVNGMHASNSAVCGLELQNYYIVGCYAGDNTAIKMVFLKIDKTLGNIDGALIYGIANESWKPFSIQQDNSRNIYITGLATDGATSKALIIKLNDTFNEVWQKQYGSYHDNFLFDLHITNNLLTAVGSANSGNVYDPSFYGWQGGKGWILKIDTETGYVLKELFDDSLSSFNSIEQINDSGYVIAGIESIDNTKPYWFNTVVVKLNERLETEK